MPKYARIVVVNAFQMTAQARSDNSTWPVWLTEAWNRRYGRPGSLAPRNYPYSTGDDPLILRQGDTWVHVEFDDWLVYADGGLTVVKPDAFSEVYRPLE